MKIAKIKASRKEPECCPTCGRPIIRSDYNLTPIQRRILDIVDHHGEIKAEVLHAALWSSDPNGGPHLKTLHVHVHQMNKRLLRDGIAVRARRGWGNGYRIIAEAAE